MNSMLYELQKSVYSALSGDTTLAALIEGVYDDPPENTSYPYITLGDVTSVPWRSHDRPGEEATITIHIWSQQAGFTEALSILKETNRILGYVNLSVTGWDIVRCEYEFSETLRDLDGLTRHVPVRYRVRGLEI